MDKLVELLAIVLQFLLVVTVLGIAVFVTGVVVLGAISIWELIF